jgi:hypothetical protein
MEEPLAYLSRSELQLNIMRNLEFEVKQLHKRNQFRVWWEHSRNWFRVQAILNGNTLKAGSTSSSEQCHFMGVDPDGYSFLGAGK